MNYIQELEKIKASITNNSIKEIDRFINVQKSLKDIEKLHLYLIEKVMSLHNNEIDTTNNYLCSTFLNINDILDKAKHGKTGCGMYFFNDSIPYYFIGDIHSDSKSVLRILTKIDFITKILNNEKFNLVFLGDYVDRGACHIKTIELILILKYLFPKNIFLIRGNHDGGTLLEDSTYKLVVGRNSNTTDDTYFVAYVYNFLKESDMQLSLLGGYLKFFNSLTTKCFIKTGREIILGVHGGIPRPYENKFDYITKLSDLTDDSIIDNIGRTIVHNMLWSDPSEEPIDVLREKGRFHFDISHFNEFTKRIGITKLIRGHQAFSEGYKEFFGGNLISIFSSGKLCSNENTNINDETAYQDEVCAPSILLVENGMKKVIKL